VSGALTIRNRQRTRPVSVSFFRQLAIAYLRDLLALRNFDLGLYLVAAPEMTRLNETFLHHPGSTDVITFDYTEPAEVSHQALRAANKLKDPQSPLAPALHGEIFLCVDEAVLQARRFRTTWQSELVRYCIHGVLHLQGHDDHQPPARRRMKREENRFLHLLATRFDLNLLSL
jgi:rRNA maturation RNase YbeY